jgi:hypothetical protein
VNGDYNLMLQMLQSGMVQPVADRGPTGPRGINAIAAPESGGVRPYAGGANPSYGSTPGNYATGLPRLKFGNKPITPEIKRRMEKRLENAQDDVAVERVIRDAAQYGVDWTMYGSQSPGKW